MLLRKPPIENKNHPYNQILLIFTEACSFICTTHTHTHSLLEENYFQRVQNSKQYKVHKRPESSL